MRDLLDIRKDIDRIDRKIVRLFEERMHCSEEVAEYKKGTGKPIYDREREQQKIEALTGEVGPEFLKKGTEATNGQAQIEDLGLCFAAFCGKEVTVLG